MDKIINITPRDFGGRIRSGDILGVCNMLENIRLTENDPTIKIYLPDESVYDADYVYQFRDFLIDHTNYFSKEPGNLYLNLDRFNMWDYRSNINDSVIVDNSSYIKKSKVCIFPLFDAPYNNYRNWDIRLLQSLIDKFSLDNFDEYFICSSQNNKSVLDKIDLKKFNISYDCDQNMSHIMDCSLFIGGETGLTLLSSCLSNPPINVYYYSCRSLMHTFPFYWKTKGDLKMYSEYGWVI